MILQLPPEQGGLTFGPFTGIVQLGTDTRRTQIQLDSRQGIYPVHATLALTSTGVHQFAPAQMEAKCFVAQQGSGQVWPVTSAVEVKSGDSLILGTPGGPRFLLVESGLSAPIASPSMGTHASNVGTGFLAMLDNVMRPRHRSRRSGNLGQGIADEFMRRGQAQLFRQGPLRQFYYLYHRARTGALLNPYTIVTGLLALVGMLSAGTVSCFGGLIALWTRLF